MDAVQFGRWFSDRRRNAGWNSQRTLAESAHHHQILREYGITEDFLARLEAGHFVHPFRGSVRRRVLALICLLCKTPRDVRAYLQAAELTELHEDEIKQMHWLNKRLVTQRVSTVLSLPPRPPRLFGRDTLLHTLVHTLAAGETGLWALTGMPGVGKSVLAYEVLHQLAFNEDLHLHAFPNGIATFTGTGRRGTGGLLALLNEIAVAFSPAAPAVRTRQASLLPAGAHNRQEADDGDLMQAADRVRTALAEKQVLILLDDLDAQFPLRQALDVLLAPGQYTGREGNERGHTKRIVLTTSRYIPAPNLMTAHFHVMPLEPDAALDLLATLLGRSLHTEERADAQRLCAAMGYLPLAMEAVATAVIAKGIPIALLAARAAEYPLDTLLDGDGELRTRLTQALSVFDPDTQQRFALLSTLGVRSFRLESAAAIHTPSAGLWAPEHATEEATYGSLVSVVEENTPMSLTRLASTAGDLGQFVRHSLIELASGDELASATAGQPADDRGQYYLMHPLLYAHAQDRAIKLAPEVLDTAQHNIQGYAQAYIERYCSDITRLERERDLLLAALAQAWRKDQYQHVVKLVSGLMYSAGRLGDYEEGERVIHWGVQASQRLQDRYHLVCFLNRLGTLLYYQGKLTQAKQVWEECLEIIESLGRPEQLPARLWFPLANLALIPVALGDYDIAHYPTERYIQRAQAVGDPILFAHALLVRCAYARLRGEYSSAYDDASSSLHLLSLHPPANSYGYLLVQAQTELARIQGDYARSREYTDILLSFFQETGDRYNLPQLLLEQAHFALQQNELTDARTLAQGALRLAEQVRAPQLRRLSIALLQQLQQGSLS